MLFTIVCTDRPGQLETRMASRAAHLAFLDDMIESLVHVGPLLDEAGQPCGSLLVVDAADHPAAASLAANDPYAKAGLFATVTIHGHRIVYRDGARLV